jgi:hypothetical protein
MCNPPLYDSGISISECNATGLWSPFDASLETLCLETKQSRNIFSFYHRNDILQIKMFNLISKLKPMKADFVFFNNCNGVSKFVGVSKVLII